MQGTGESYNRAFVTRYETCSSDLATHTQLFSQYNPVCLITSVWKNAFRENLASYAHTASAGNRISSRHSEWHQQHMKQRTLGFPTTQRAQHKEDCLLWLHRADEGVLFIQQVTLLQPGYMKTTILGQANDKSNSWLAAMVTTQVGC